MLCDPRAWNITRCNAAKFALKKLGTLIGQQLLFKVPVNVCIVTSDIGFYKIAEPKVYLLTDARQLLDDGSVGPLLRYPASLAKQVWNINEKLHQKLQQNLPIDLVRNIMSYIPKEKKKCDFKIDANDYLDANDYIDRGKLYLKEFSSYSDSNFITFIAQRILTSLVSPAAWVYIRFLTIKDMLFQESINLKAEIVLSI